MQCRECKHWQGNKYDEWGDCYRVVAQLEPDLTCCYTTTEYGAIERFFSVPFDPHEFKYWVHNEVWLKLYRNIVTHIPCLGVRVQSEKREDIVYDQKAGERLGKVTYHYFQTHKDYDCKEECVINEDNEV